ncbi:MAG: YbfB/YjiJ family MFS transporter [Deltaproteobacteria bacterium]|nr:YbfB/YjiJ family MFS transporter [Deltaproteobacteria bacterium]
MTIFSCIGLARFAYGMLLPSMAKALALGYDRMGFISTANFAGYMTAVGFAPFVMRRAGSRATVTAGLIVVALGMVALGSASGFVPLLLFYTLTGIGSGLANIPVMVLVSHWFTRSLRGRAAGIMVAGNGVAIVFVGLLVPRLNRALGDAGWRAGWWILGGLSVLVAVAAGLLIRNAPEDIGLKPCGEPDPAAAPRTGGGAAGRHILAHLGLLYLLFGATYTVYATFAVTSMVAERGLPEASAGRFWSAVGFFSLFSGPLFGSLSDRIGRKWGIGVVFAVQTVAYLLAGLPLGPWALAVSVVLFGLAAWSIPSIMAAAAGDYLGSSRAAAGFSAITFCLGGGQVAGPALAGVVAKGTGSFSAGFLMAAGATAAAAILSMLLPKPPR